MNDYGQSTIPISAAAIAMLAADMGADIGVPLARLDPPDRLSVDKSSPHYDIAYKRLGVRLDGQERQGDVQEYCVSEGWILVRAKTATGQFKLDGHGAYILHELRGKVEPFWKTPPAPQKAIVQSIADHEGHKAAADDKRRRRAERNARLAE